MSRPATSSLQRATALPPPRCPVSVRESRSDAPEGTVYCRVLDLYVDAGTKARAEALHFTEAHRALCS